MAEKRDILFRFLGDAKSLDRATKDAKGGLGRMEGAMGTATKAAGALGLALGASQVAQYAVDAIQLAVTAEEVDSKFQAVYGSAVEFEQAISDWSDQAGVTDADAKDLVATFGNLAMAQGLSKDETEILAEKVAELSGDMGSFNDSDPQVVFEDLNKAMLTTEREGLKKYGISVSEAEVKTRALALATEDGRSEVTQADRALASYEIIVGQAGVAVGDLDRTTDSLANQQRRLKARLEETQTELGRELMPIYEDFLSVSEDLIPVLGNVVGEVGELVGAYEDASAAVSIAAGDGQGGLGGFLAKAGGVVDFLNSKLNPGMWALESVFGDVTENAAGTNEAMGGTSEAIEGIKYALSGIDDDLYGYGAAAHDAAGDVGELAGETWDAEAAMRALIERIGYFDAGKVAREVEASKTDADNERDAIIRRYGHAGGMVPGTGQNVPMMLQGGERIIPRGGGGEGTVVNINIGVAGDPYAVARQIADLLERYETANGTRISGVGT